MLTLSLSLLSGCVFNLETSREPGTQASTTTASGITTPGTTGSSSASSNTTSATKPSTVPATIPGTIPSTKPATQPTTKPATQPVTKPTTKPVTKPTTKPVTTPSTQPATKPVTKPSTQPTTKPATKPASGTYSDISNARNEWSYGYPDSWVTGYSGYWKFTKGNLYLTMDLGYEMGYTGKILDILKQKGVKVTFFLTTEYIKEEPGYVKRMLAEGHKIGNHSTKHINMVTLVGENGTDLVANTEKWEVAYKNLTGRTSNLYRAPEGVFSKRGMTVLEDMGYKTIFWGAAYADYDANNQPSVEAAKSKLYKYVDSGDVVLLHPFKTNSQLLPDFIDDMRARGFDFALIP